MDSYGPNGNQVERFLNRLAQLSASEWARLDRVGWGVGHTPRAWFGRLMVYRALRRWKRSAPTHMAKKAELRAAFEPVEAILQSVNATPVQRGAILLGLLAVANRRDMDAAVFRRLYGQLERVLPAAQLSAE